MRSRVALALAGFLTATAAQRQECHRNFTISPTDNTTDLFSPCHTIIGNINIGAGFNASVDLRNVYNITGTIDLQDNYARDSDRRSIVHFLQAPDLVYLGGLNIYDFSVYELYMRNLEVVGDVAIYVDEYSLNLDLESLVEARSINISRALSTIDFEALETVHGALIVNYHKANSSSNEDLGFSNHGRIDFPSLGTAGSVMLAGATKNITLPRLTSVGPQNDSDSEVGSQSGLNIHMEDMEEGFELDLPRLRSVDDQINLYGNLKELHTPQLTTYTSINITSSTSFPCTTYLSTLSSTTSVTCTSTPSKGLSTGAKIAIGVVVPVVVIAGIAAVVVFCMRKKSRRESRARMELRGLQGDLAAERQQERGGNHGGDGDGRPLTPPPPYSSQGR
ncbi:hypothetical protein BJX70DRAFT_397492 [Aspergillus crustosus]